ncbi:MAG: hypothetical protein H7Y59_19640 [Anaerolineales bacterium]|nr:hypothetical protein [Anaerolineales bacterium]
MDWNTIFTAVITSILSSSLITAGIIYLVKKSLDRMIDLRYEKILEETKLQMQEVSRRKSALYDQQAKIFQECISHIHRLRRIAHSIQGLSSQEIRGAKRKEFDKILTEFRQNHKEFEEFISENRVLLKIKYAETQHDLRSVLTSIEGYRMLIGQTQNQEESDQMIDSLKASLFRLDEQYFRLLEDAQTFLGTSDD